MLTHSFAPRQIMRCEFQEASRKDGHIGKLILPYLVLVDVVAEDGTPVRLTFGAKSEEQGHNIEIAFQTMIACLPPSQRARVNDQLLRRGDSFFHGNRDSPRRHQSPGSSPRPARSPMV